MKKALIEQARVYVSVENLATISDLPKGYDPEGDTSNSIVWDYPYYRTISVGANITF